MSFPPRCSPCFRRCPSDFYLKYCHQYTFLGYEQDGLRLLDVGKLDSLDQAEEFLQ